MRTDALLPGIGIEANDELGRILSGTTSGPPSLTATVSANPNAAGRFAVGCRLADTTDGKQYTMNGTVEEPAWNDLSSITPSEFDLPEGATLVGNASGKAEATVLAPGEILMGDNSSKATGTQISGDVQVTPDGSAELSVFVFNDTANNWSPGQLLNVMTNADGSTGVQAADNISGVPATHVVKNGILTMTDGYVYQNQRISGIDTSAAAAVGDKVFLGVNGALVFTNPPSGGTVLTQPVGRVAVVDVNGEVQFNLPGSGAIPYALEWPTSYIKNDAITYVKTKSTNAEAASLYVYNSTGGALNPGTFVNVEGKANGQKNVILADSATGIPATHIVTNDGVAIGDTQYGYIGKGVIYGSMDTSTAVGVGSKVYLDVLGGYVFDTPPAGAGVLTQCVGYVLVKDVNGVIWFYPQDMIGADVQLSTPFIKDDAVTAAKIGASFAFAGDAMGNHAHSIYYQADALTTPAKRLYTGTITGATPVAGATLVQAGSGATADVLAYDNASPGDHLDVNNIVGTFDSTNVVTGTNPDTSTFTFTPTMTMVDVWTTNQVPCAFSQFTSNDGTILTQGSGHANFTLGASKVRYVPFTNNRQLETLTSDGWTGLYVEYAIATSANASAGTPTGTINVS